MQCNNEFKISFHKATKGHMSQFDYIEVRLCKWKKTKTNMKLVRINVYNLLVVFLSTLKRILGLCSSSDNIQKSTPRKNHLTFLASVPFTLKPTNTYINEIVICALYLRKQWLITTFLSFFYIALCLGCTLNFLGEIYNREQCIIYYNITLLLYIQPENLGKFR